MGYIGQSPQIAQSTYQSIDDISSSFDGSTTSFALQVGGVSPVPFPIASENCLISVGGVIQEPDGTGTNGFQLTGTNIVFSAAPASGQSFFGVILAGADYVTAGHAFPDGDAGTPSITFNQDLDTGLFRGGTGITSVSSNNNKIADFGPTAIVFNEDGDDVDFRVEGDTKANLFVVDAGNDKITLDGDLEPTTINGITFPTAGPLSNRNLVIGGAMNIAQRGTSTSVAAADGDTFLVDRFFNLMVGSAVATYSQSTESPAGFTNSLKLDITTADTDLSTDNQIKIEHRVEGYNSAFLGWGSSDAKTVTLSFWIRSNLTGNTQVAFVNLANDRNYVATFTIDSANTWEKKTLTVPGDTGGTWNTSNDTGIRLRWGSFGTDFQTCSVDQWVANSTQLNSRSDSPINFASSTDNELYLTGVQLEVGEKATPFEHRSYGDELARCQRYFQKFGRDESGKNRLIGSGNGGSNPLFGFTFPYIMRATPTLNYYGGNTDGGSFNVHAPSETSTSQTAPSFADPGKRSVRWNFTGQSGGATKPHFIDMGTAANQFGFTADAEL